jgi:hypothetical protein
MQLAVRLSQEIAPVAWSARFVPFRLQDFGRSSCPIQAAAALEFAAGGLISPAAAL